MTQSLSEFVKQIKTDAAEFEAAYQSKHQANPEDYPLTMPEGNEGLWLEFFLEFQRGNEE